MGGEGELEGEGGRGSLEHAGVCRRRGPGKSSSHGTRAMACVHSKTSVTCCRTKLVPAVPVSLLRVRPLVVHHTLVNSTHVRKGSIRAGAANLIVPKHFANRREAA